MNIYGHLPKALSHLKEATDFEPELDERLRCLCGELIDSDDPDEAFCIDCKVAGAEILCGILENEEQGE